MKKKPAETSNQLRLEYVPLDTLKLWDKNPKKHDLKQITDAIYRYGFQDPAKFDSSLGGLVFGNGRTEALIKAREDKREPPRGILLNTAGQWCVPVLFGNDLTSQGAATAFAIDHNNLTMAGSHTPEDMARMWTAEGYLSLMRGLKDANDMPITAWMPKEELPADPGAQMDKAEELLKKWKVKVGDLWEIGEHRIICGDSTKPESYECLLDRQTDRCIVMAFTDPPWNVAIGKDTNPRHRQRKGLENDDMNDERFAEFLKRFIIELKNYLSGDLYCVLGNEQMPQLDVALRELGFHWSAIIIWVKDVFVLGRSKYHRRYEPIWYGWLKKSKSSFCGSRALDDVWEIPRPKQSEEHPTMKPVSLVERAITNSSKRGDIVCDPFSGSGTTLVACERLKRKGRAIEIAPEYVAVTLERLAGMGLEPKLVNRKS